MIDLEVFANNYLIPSLAIITLIIISIVLSIWFNVLPNIYGYQTIIFIIIGLALLIFAGILIIKNKEFAADFASPGINDTYIKSGYGNPKYDYVVHEAHEAQKNRTLREAEAARQKVLDARRNLYN